MQDSGQDSGHVGPSHPVAVVTGASQGLGLEIAVRLAAAGWSLVIDARDAVRLHDAADVVSGERGVGAVAGDRAVGAVAGDRAVGAVAGDRGARGTLEAIAGDITDPDHRTELAAAARRLGDVRLVVNNASTLGASPLPTLDEIDDATLRRVFDVNVVAPVALVRELAGDLGPGAVVVEVTSDAGVEPYPTWGGYGASKAALEHAGRVLAVEHPEWRVLVVDPGDMRTQMHQDAFPGEDISDRPLPAGAADALVELVSGDAPSGRYSLVDTGAPA
jgi:NAD(P)-dependent dehydrogenase (short-subunit alcohol dehydrogenase family)